jgi:hypothetical protein
VAIKLAVLKAAKTMAALLKAALNLAVLKTAS